MNEIKKIWYQDLDYSMILVCALGILCVVMFQLTQNNDKETSKDKLAGVGNYFIPSWKNILFQIICGYLMLSIIPELGLPIFKAITKGLGFEMEIDSVEKVAHTLAAFCGVFGGYFVAKIIKKIQK